MRNLHSNKKKALLFKKKINFHRLKAFNSDIEVLKSPHNFTDLQIHFFKCLKQEIKNLKMLICLL